ncbi:hypothetical protein C3L33_10321, partial [Rhododendron williamsianum]
MAQKLAQKRAPLEEDPPSASSSSTSEDDQPTDNEQEENHNQELPKETAESESSEDEDEDEDEEEEEVQNNKPSVQKPTPTTTATKTPQPNSPSDSDSGSDSETRSAQPFPTASDFTIKPIASKPMENPKKPTSKPSAKRPVTETDEKNGKIKKVKVEEEEEVEKSVEERGGPIFAHGEFHEFIKKSLSVEVSRSQLMDKVRRLKKKYEINAGQGEKGADPVFSKPHEHKCFGLSKKVWGCGKDSSNGVDENGKSGNERARKTVKLENSVALQPKENGKGVVFVRKAQAVEAGRRNAGKDGQIASFNVREEDLNTDESANSNIKRCELSWKKILLPLLIINIRRDQPTDNEEEENHSQELPKETAESESSEDDEKKKMMKENNSASDFTIKPIASKPMENPKKPTSKPSAKRPVTETDNGKIKKAKVEEEEKKSGGSVNRLWSEDDETVILKGMTDFQSKKGADPSSLTGEFHEFIRKSLSVEVSRSQLMDKVWGVGKDSSNGVDENGNNGKSGNKRVRKTVKLEDSVALQPKENGKGVVGLKEGLKGEMKDVKVEDKEPGKSFMVESMSMIGKVKAKELEKKWKSLREDEVALYLKRMELMNEQTKLVLDAMKASKD